MGMVYWLRFCKDPPPPNVLRWTDYDLERDLARPDKHAVGSKDPA